MTPKHCCDWDGDHLIGPCLNNGQQDEKHFNKFCYDLDPWLIQYSSWYKTDSILLFLTYRHFCSTWARWNKSEIIFGLTLIIKRSVMNSHWLGLKSLHIMNKNALIMWKIKQIELNEQHIYALKREILLSPIWRWPL